MPGATYKQVIDALAAVEGEKSNGGDLALRQHQKGS